MRRPEQSALSAPQIDLNVARVSVDVEQFAAGRRKYEEGVRPEPLRVSPTGPLGAKGLAARPIDYLNDVLLPKQDEIRPESANFKNPWSGVLPWRHRDLDHAIVAPGDPQ